jgi:uncharacterized membrane protein YcaP (DUF421 family)
MEAEVRETGRHRRQRVAVAPEAVCSGCEVEKEAVLIESMFHLPLPLLEKILRPVLVYLFLVGFLRLFGKRELAQLNPFDLVVLLSLSNTVQNAMIGDDNSVSGGVIGAFSLLAINWLLTRVLFRAPKLNQFFELPPTVLIRHGVVDWEATKKEALTELELRSVLHKQGFDSYEEVEKCVLEPNGNFYMEGIKAMSDDAQRAELMKAIESLTREVKDMRAELATR